MIWDVHSGSGIHGSKKHQIPDPEHCFFFYQHISGTWLAEVCQDGVEVGHGEVVPLQDPHLFSPAHRHHIAEHANSPNQSRHIITLLNFTCSNVLSKNVPSTGMVPIIQIYWI